MSHYSVDTNNTWERWCENANRSPDSIAIAHWAAADPPRRWTWGELISTAESYREVLLSNGLRRGDVCAIVARHNPLLYPIYMACVSAGLIPSILAYPNPRLHPDKFREGLQGMSERSGLDYILTERTLEDTLRPLLMDSHTTIKGIRFPFEIDRATRRQQGSTHGKFEARLSENTPLLLQHSSGTTGLQKPVLLSHRAVLEHVATYGRVLQISQCDKIVSWLPLYHDMGLIASLHLPLALGITTIQIDPFEWVLCPSLLLDAITQEGATITWLPNFSLSMMADKIKDEDITDIDLSTLRMVINCSEPVRFNDQEKFLKRFSSRGLRQEALSSCYAMAETTFAVTQTPPGRAPTTLAVDATQLSKGIVSPPSRPNSSAICISSGELIPGCEIRIVDETDNDLGEGRVGEIVIKSRSMFDGYRNYPEKTTEVLRNGWYSSGDIGFRSGADLFVIGRKKDIVIVAGNNIYPEDVESQMNGITGLIPGRIVAFGEEDLEFGSERLSVAAETAITDEGARQHLRLEIIKAAMAIDVTIHNVYLVPPRFLIKSSAGKPSRSANKARLMHGSFRQAPASPKETQ